MKDIDTVIAAFTEEQVERLAGLTRRQLRYWDKTGFFEPSLAYEDRRAPFARIYSFRDLVELRTLASLRNNFKVPLQHLRVVAERLSHLRDSVWSGTTLYVLNRRVVFHEPETDLPREVVSGQFVIQSLKIQEVINATNQKTVELSRRDSATFGHITRHRFVARNAYVIAGTRVPVSAIRHFLEDGYSAAQILREYPSLTKADVEAVAEKFRVHKAA